LDAVLGARVGLLRYGDQNDLLPQGWQLDAEGAAFPRLDNEGSLVAADYRAGLPLTTRQGPWNSNWPTPTTAPTSEILSAAPPRFSANRLRPRRNGLGDRVLSPCRFEALHGDRLGISHRRPRRAVGVPVRRGFQFPGTDRPRRRAILLPSTAICARPTILAVP